MKYIRKDIQAEMLTDAESGVSVQAIADKHHRSVKTVRRFLAVHKSGRTFWEYRKDFMKNNDTRLAVLSEAEDRANLPAIPAEDRLNVLLIAIERSNLTDKLNQWLFPVGESKVGAVQYATMGMI